MSKKEIVMKGSNVDLIINEMATNELISKLSEELKKLKTPPSKTLNIEIDGVTLNEVDDVLELLKMRIEVRKTHNLMLEESKLVSEKLKTKSPYNETDEFIATKINAIDHKIQSLTYKEKIESLEAAIKNLKELRSDEEQKEAQEKEKASKRQDVLSKVAALIQIGSNEIGI
jgi:hypothetical protein